MTLKYKVYFSKMLEENKEVFDKFTKAHFEYSTDPDSHQDAFNREGEKVLGIVNEYENRLCKSSEGAGYGTYTGNLSEKFRNEVKSHFPLIDHIGIVAQKFDNEIGFSIKKINV